MKIVYVHHAEREHNNKSVPRDEQDITEDGIKEAELLAKKVPLIPAVPLINKVVLSKANPIVIPNININNNITLLCFLFFLILSPILIVSNIYYYSINNN